MIATAYSGNSAMVNYDIFVAVFGLLSLLYLLPTSFLDSYSMPLVNMALDALNVLFWFCAAVATAAYLGVHSCSNRVRSIQLRLRRRFFCYHHHLFRCHRHHHHHHHPTSSPRCTTPR